MVPLRMAPEHPYRDVSTHSTAVCFGPAALVVMLLILAPITATKRQLPACSHTHAFCLVFSPACYGHRQRRCHPRDAASVWPYRGLPEHKRAF